MQRCIPYGLSLPGIAAENGSRQGEWQWTCGFPYQLGIAQQAAQRSAQLVKDVKTLIGWLRQHVLELAGPELAIRLDLYDFVVAELREREHLDKKRIGKVRLALQNQRDDLLAFAGVLDRKLQTIAQDNEVGM